MILELSTYNFPELVWFFLVKIFSIKFLNFFYWINVYFNKTKRENLGENYLVFLEISTHDSPLLFWIFCQDFAINFFIGLMCILGFKTKRANYLVFPRNYSTAFHTRFSTIVLFFLPQFLLLTFLNFFIRLMCVLTRQKGRNIWFSTHDFPELLTFF